VPDQRFGTDFWPDYKDKPELLATLATLARLVEKVVDYGGNVLAGQASSHQEEYLPVILAYRHALELLGAVATLIRASGVNPCKILLRSVFESLLTIEYILEKQTTKRGMAFLVCHIHNKMKLYQNLEPNTQAGRQYQQSIKADKFIGSVRLDILPNAPALRANLEKCLTRKVYAQAAAEYQDLKRSTKKRSVQWFEMFGGPKNIRELADYLRVGGCYGTLYRFWSGAVHGTDLIDEAISGEAHGKAAVLQINIPREAQNLAIMSVCFGLEMHRKIIKKVLRKPLAEYRTWYTKHIRPAFVALSQQQVISVRHP
jgi:hypothetical protein